MILFLNATRKQFNTFHAPQKSCKFNNRSRNKSSTCVILVMCVNTRILVLFLIFIVEHKVKNVLGVRCYYCNAKCGIPVEQMFTYECSGLCHQMHDETGIIIYRACGRHFHLGCKPFATTYKLCTCIGDLCNGTPLIGETTTVAPKSKSKCYKCSKEECSKPVQEMEIVECEDGCKQDLVVTDIRGANHQGCGRNPKSKHVTEGCIRLWRDEDLARYLCGCKGDLCNGKLLYVEKTKCYHCLDIECSAPLQDMQIIGCIDNCFKQYADNGTVVQRNCGYYVEQNELQGNCKKELNNRKSCLCKGNLCNGK